MNELNQIGIWLADLPVYTLNGLLIILYWLVGHLAMLLCLACGGITAWLPDVEIQNRASYRPGRAGHVIEGSFLRTAQVMTGLVLLLWIIAQWDMAAPVPWIGATMWVCGLLSEMVLTNQRFNLLWYVKAGIAIYALLVIASRIYLAYTSQLTAEQWAALIGSSQSAAAVVAGTQSNVTTVVLWALWLVAPLGYFSMLVQQIFINPMSIVSPWAGAQDMLRSLRVRDGR